MAENDKPTPLKPQQAKAIAALLTESNTRAAAAACGTSETQLRRWLGLPAFQAELRTASSAAIDVAIMRLSAMTAEAVDVLQEIMTDENASPGTRLQAVNIHLSRLLDYRNMVTLEKRIEELERKIQ
jgi:hypothetical protein